MNIHNRWSQLVASVIAMVMIANLQYAWTLFVNPIQQGTGWKLSDIQWAFTLFILFQTWVQPLQGWLIDRMGPRVFTTIAGVLCGVGWGGLGMVTTLPMLYTLYVMAGIGAAWPRGSSRARLAAARRSSFRSSAGRFERRAIRTPSCGPASSRAR